MQSSLTRKMIDIPSICGRWVGWDSRQLSKFDRNKALLTHNNMEPEMY